MELARSLPHEIHGVLSRGGTVLTGNQHAAHTLRLDYDRQRQDEGLVFWQPPAIFAWDTWLSNLWRQMLLDGCTDRLLLNRTQELHLWRSIISADSDSDANPYTQWSSLESIDSLATLAADAWQQLCAYGGQLRLKSLGVSGDTRAFQRWAQSFSRRCQKDLYLSPSELEAAIAHTVTMTGSKTGSRTGSRTGCKTAGNDLLLIGFDTTSPAQTLLLASLREAGVSITHRPPAINASQSHLVAAKDLDEELTSAARWIRRYLEANPDARIAVIHPDIASERAELDRVFRQILAPELQDIAADPATGPYEFSLGHPLSQQPMVATALTLLRWTIASLSIDEISHLLLSPWFASGASETRHRAEFDAFELRQATLLRPELDLPTFIEHVVGSDRAADLRSLLKQLRDLQRNTSKLLLDDKQKSFADWADNIRELLLASGWASAAPDTSVEYQARRKWEGSLDELTTLDFEGTRTNFAEALHYLDRITQRTLFAPESNNAPVQIMGPLEAAGSEFDALYFLRFSDLSWPVRPGMNPLLGWRLQRDLRMPGSDAVEDAAHARRITERLTASAPTVVFSYARETTDAHQRPSAALAAFAYTPLPGLPPAEPTGVMDLESVEDSAFIPLEDPRVQGGAGILQLQAACGFRAFAEMRLRSTAPESREPGMDARERGSIVHVALEVLWKELRTQATLRALTAEQRTAALARSIDQSLNRFQQAATSTWDAAYLDLQRERLHRLLNPWLEVELARSPFEVLIREKREEDVAIGPLLLSLRIDRVDRVFNDAGEELGEVVLDYKTGIAGPSDWQGDRPEAPQLPLYAALRESGTVAGIAFASLRPGKEMGLRGLAADQGVLPNPGKYEFETLEDQIAVWHRILTKLAIDFADGDTRIRPKTYPGTCEFCRQRILCRLDPTTLEDLNEEADDNDA